VKIDKSYRPETCVSKGKDPNPLLTDPFLDAKEERLVSTNGFALVALPVDTEKGERSRYLACQLLKAARSLGDNELPAEIHDEEVVEKGVLWRTAQERQFIDWMKVVPKFKRGSSGTVTFALRPDLLSKIATAMGTGAVALTIELGRAEDRPSPIIVQPLDGDGGHGALGLLMPVAADGAGEPILAPGQICPECRRILAAGAPCPVHGAVVPPVNAEAPPAKGKTTATLSMNGGPEVPLESAEAKELVQKAVAGAVAHLGVRSEPASLRWHKENENQMAETEAGTYCAEPRKLGGFTVYFSPLGDGRTKRIDQADTLGNAKAAARRHQLDAIASALTGTKADGPAATTRKKGRR
jgi:hypothetical protein